MRFAAFGFLLALLGPALAQNDTAAPSEFAQTVLTALQDAGLTTLASAITALAGTPAGMAFLQQLEDDDDATVFAPTNEAFTSAGLPEDFSGDQAGGVDMNMLAQIILYHVANDDFEVNNIGVSPMHTIVDTFLQISENDNDNDDDDDDDNDDVEVAGNMLNFPNGTTIPLVLTRESQDAAGFQIFNNGQPISVTSDPVEVGDVRLFTIDQVIPMPSSLADVAESAQLSQLATALTDAGLLETLNMSMSGLTIFAPNNAAFEAIASDIEGLSQDQVALVLQNHVVNGTIAFSDDVADDAEDDNDDDDNDNDNDDQVTPLAGPAFTFMTNETGTFVMSGDASAQLVATDYLFNGGVVHVIDSVLVNQDPEVNEPTPTGGGGGTNPSGTGGDGSQSSSPAGEDEDSEEDAGNSASKAVMSWGLGGVVVTLGAVLGGGLLSF